MYICYYGFYPLHNGSIRANAMPRSDKKVIPLCCKTAMQTCCGLTDCTGKNPENGLSVWRILKSCISYKFSVLHSYFHCCLSFQSCRQALKNKHVTKTDQFGTAQWEMENYAVKATAFVIT